MKSAKGEKLYYCNPNKNKECAKEACLYSGKYKSCYLTIEKSYKFNRLVRFVKVRKEKAK